MTLHPTGDTFADIQRCGAWYSALVDGERVGPLAGYTGRYGRRANLQYVGFEYLNMGRVIAHPPIVRDFAARLVAEETRRLRRTTLVVGTPTNGVVWGFALAIELGCRFASARKIVTAPATTKQREQSTLVLPAEGVEPDDVIVVADDVCNNATSSGSLADQVTRQCNRPPQIACIWNRSGDPIVVREKGVHIPVISLMHRQLDQFRQDDPQVISAIAAGAVIWKPKDHWPELLTYMQR